MSDNHIEVYSTKDIDVEQMLAELRGGMRLSVHRDSPSWCKGHLATLYVDDDEPISLEYLKDEFGGKRLLLKILDDGGKIRARRIVEFPEPPRKEGVELKQLNNIHDDANDKGLFNVFLENQARQHEAMLKLVIEQSKATQQILRERIEDQRNAHQQLSTTQNSLRETMELMEFVENLKDKLKTESTNDEFNPLYKQMLDMGEKFFTLKLEKDQKKVEQQLKLEAIKETAPELPQRPINQSHPPNHSLNEIDDIELLKHAAKRFSNMPTDKQKIAFDLFSQQISEHTEKNIDERKNSSAESDSMIEIDKSEQNKDKELELLNAQKRIEVSLDVEDERDLDAIQNQPITTS